MQIWPALRNLPALVQRAASSMSASSAMITGAWPPSSMVTRFMWRPASAANSLPIGVEPVKVSLRITGLAIKWAEICAGSPNTRPTVPGGSPASTRAAITAAGAEGVSSGALTRQEQPVASAAPSLRTTWLMGKFQGVKAATGPTGSLSTICCTARSRAGTMRP
ncbi:hypothetical protein D3C71_1639230 [compost metagenome]